MQLPAKASGEIVITAPFKHRVTAGKSTKIRTSVAPREHPLQRARRWHSILNTRPEITARALAKQERVSEATMSLTLRLLTLTPGVQKRLSASLTGGIARHLGLRPLNKIARLPAGQQSASFTALLANWQSMPKQKVDAVTG